MWGQFWSAHQRFFKYLCISAKVKHCVKLARDAVKNNKVSYSFHDLYFHHSFKNIYFTLKFHFLSNFSALLLVCNQPVKPVLLNNSRNVVEN